MKKNTLILFISLLTILYSFTGLEEDESIYVNKYIKYSVERDHGQAIIKLDVKDIEDYSEIYIRRSDNPTENFRQVKYLKNTDGEQLEQISVVKDKYPLPGNVDSYYKVVAIDNNGIYKLFPCVKLSKY